MIIMTIMVMLLMIIISLATFHPFAIMIIVAVVAVKVAIMFMKGLGKLALGLRLQLSQTGWPSAHCHIRTCKYFGAEVDADAAS